MVDAVGHFGRAGQARPTEKIGVDEAETGVAFESFQIGGTSRAQIIDRHNLVTAVQMESRNMGSDETRAAGDENIHKWVLASP
jgi:hypothetical protein